MQEETSQQGLSARSRSMSESHFRSTRAEKRMGRLFKQQQQQQQLLQPQSLQPQPQTSQQTQPQTQTQIQPQSQIQTQIQTQSQSQIQTQIQTQTQTQRQQQQSAQLSISQSSTNGLQSSALSTPFLQQPQSQIKTEIVDSLHSANSSDFINTASAHSNSSSISSQVGSTSSNQTSSSGSLSALSPQLPRKLSLGSSLNYMYPNKHLHQFDIHGLDSQVLEQNNFDDPQDYDNAALQLKIKSREPFSKLSTLPETSPVKRVLSLESLLRLSKKYKYIYEMFLSSTEIIDNQLKLSSNSFGIFLAVLENVQKKLHQKDKENICESLTAHLTLSLVDSMSDLKSYIENLKLSLTSNIPKIDLESIRMSYFSLFSLFLELTNICKFLLPNSTWKKTSNSSSSSLNQLKLRASSSNTQPSQPLPFPSKPRQLSTIINRIPAPNPQYPSQSLTMNNGRLTQQVSQQQVSQQQQISQQQPQQPQQPLQPLQQTNISRQHLKIDTNLNFGRQDSELSVSSNQSDGNNTTIDDEKLYELISHTIQAAQVVFSQLNSAISKSAILTAQTLDSNENDLNTISFKVKDLTNQCMESMEQTKRVKNLLNNTKNSPKSDEESQKNLYEQTNLFLKSIINILAATKGAIQNLPTLNEVRSALSNLTRATKELTIKLESSSLKQSVISTVPSSTNLVEQPPLSSIPSIANFQQGSISAGVSSFSQHMFTPDSANAPPLSAAIPLPQNKSQNIMMNKIKQESSHNILESKSSVGALDSMQQHIKNLQSTSVISDPNLQPSLSVTTPLIASIGPAVASAVLPITSPMKGNTNIATSTNTNTNINSNSSLPTPPTGGNSSNNNYYRQPSQQQQFQQFSFEQDNCNPSNQFPNSPQVEQNPFDKVVVRNPN